MHVIIGGGVSGLAVAYALARSRRQFALIESSPRLGGQIWTERAADFVVERGAEGFTATSEAVPALCAELGIASRLITQTERRSFALDGESLRALAPGEAAAMLGFRVPAPALGRGIRTLQGGMSELVAALEVGCTTIGTVRKDCGVASLHRDGARWRVELDSGRTLDADFVFIAALPPAAARLVAGVAVEAARALECVRLASSVSVSLAYRRDAVAHPLDGTGFVVADDQPRGGLRACGFDSSKFVGRAPEGWCLIRAFFRPPRDDLHGVGDDDWLGRAHRLLTPVLGLSEPPRRGWVTRWPEALPPHGNDHRAAVARAGDVLASLGGIVLVGAGYRCCGIDGAIRSALEAVNER